MNPEGVSFLLHVRAPALVVDDRRLLSVVHAMERGMPGLRLSWAISDEGEVFPVPRDDVRGTERKSNGSFLLLCNADEAHLVTISRGEIPGALCSGGKPQFFVYADWPVDAPGVAAATDVLEGVAEAADSYWAHVTPNTVTDDFAKQTSQTPGGPSKTPRGLPMLKNAWELRSPDVPRHLGWLNYWSAAAARAIGFPDPARDADLLSRARRTASGGWVVRLTEAPLDLDNPAHLQELLDRPR